MQSKFSGSMDELIKSEECFRLIAEHTRDLVCVLDQVGNFIYTNPSYEKVLGYRQADLIGKSAFSFVHPDERSKILKIFQDALFKKEGAVAEFRYRHADGTMLDFEAAGNWVFDKNGEPLYGIVVSRNISSWKQKEEKLKSQVSYLHQLFENSPFGIVLLDVEDKVVEVNKSFTELFQYSLEELRGKLLDDFIIAEEFRGESKLFSRKVIEGFIVQEESIRKRKDGTRLYVAITGYPVIVSDKRVGSYAIYVDISERKALEKQMQQVQKLESIGILAGGIAHDFNNILGIILGHASFLENIKEDAQLFSKSVEAIIKASERGANLVKQILTFARKTDSKLGFIYVNDIIKELTKLYQETFPKTITFSLNLDKDLPPILGDYTQIHQALMNLAINARDAMPKGGNLSLSTAKISGKKIRERFPLARYDEYIQITVSDTGVGMDEFTKSRIFEPFFTTKGVGQGTGLGLAVVYGIVESHKGFIDVQSQLGKGSSFNIYLPIEDQTVEKQDSALSMTQNIMGGSETVLLVEDEDMLLTLLKTVLEQKGYKVLTAMDGVEAVNIYRKNYNEIDIVLSDMGLPKLGGWEAFLEMKKINPNVITILASGYVDQIARSELLKLGVREVIQKPYVPVEILKKLRELLDNK